ncbi:helix-turn-helix transcriptional regulator [Aestuariivirga litoralis]|uniref:helix-turn-helix transcriptional regulator n=1 Tax=Aestuariivirga litoralis TaxID=2650924 RepID=UPI0018C7FA60|nr:helix-turn-helix transcriptional regulator [Aestuariivirga litoralis]MBG1230748.1 helix-turn-helix transcriptional regulator [Aestuariivirga litoralis]
MKIRLPLLVMGLIAGQVICTAVFLNSVFSDAWEDVGFDWHQVSAGLAVIALVAAIGFETSYLIGLLRRKANLERSVGMASIALQEVIESHFIEWQLTASEHDVATLMVKGLSIAEIAQLRGSAEGTVKAHLNNIYRKSNTRNRAEVLSTIMDAMLDKPLLPKSL